MIGHLKHLGAKLAAHRIFAAAGPDPHAWRELKSLGINLDAVTNLAGPVVRSTVSFGEDGQFSFDEFGEIAFVMPVHAEDAETVTDLVAWSARDPATFGTLFGAGVLGLDYLLNPSSYVDRPCCLFCTPLAWLQAGCEGAVVLDDMVAKAALRAAPGALTVDSLSFGLHLLKTGLVPAERLLVPAEWRAVA